MGVCEGKGWRREGEREGRCEGIKEGDIKREGGMGKGNGCRE